MQAEWNSRRAALTAPLLLIATIFPARGFGEEPGRLGRLFRLGGNPANSSPAPPKPLAPPAPVVEDVGAGSGAPGSYPLVSPPVTSAPAVAPGASPRITPKPRVSRPVTESDPLVTRVSLGRSDDGTQFGMFLQIYADGTVIDSGGVHRVSREALRPLVEALQSSDLHRQKGHCGTTATEFIEQVQVVVYERSLGRLRANSFSFSGNTQGCDHAVHHLNTVLEALQSKITGPPTASPAARNPIAPPPAAAAPGGANTINLSPGD